MIGVMGKLRVCTLPLSKFRVWTLNCRSKPVEAKLVEAA